MNRQMLQQDPSSAASSQHPSNSNPSNIPPQSISAIDRIVQNNANYASTREGVDPSDAISPSMNLAILTCMDCRIPVDTALGLTPGQAFVIRNAGNIATEDVFRSLILATHAANIRELCVIGHTDCAVSKINELELKEQLHDKFQCTPAIPSKYHTFQSIRKNVRTQIAKLHAHPYLANILTIRGFIFDVNTGKLREVTS